MICDRHDLVVVPFPFSERVKTKRRPALVLSGRPFNRNGHTVMAMVTTKRDPSWPGDTPITDHQHAGLKRSCLVRFKLFTLDNRLILRKTGRLAAEDAARVVSSTMTILDCSPPATPDDA